MDWIKRNLFFVLGASVALVLMVGAGFYTWTGWSNNAKAREDINGKYAELQRLINLNPNPGSGKVDNVKTAREQQQALREVITGAARQFAPIPAIPPATNVTAKTFASGLSTTIHNLQIAATNAGVGVPARYNFSFEQQSGAVKFEPGSLVALSVQLGEVAAITEILIAAKINALESIQRERVSADDQAGQASDYLDQHSETNDLAILAPYQITFRCFTPELAQVICGFASSTHGMIVTNINVETAAVTWDSSVSPVASPVFMQSQPTAAPPLNRYNAESRGAGSRGAEFQQRYGLRPPPPPTPTYAPPVATLPTAPGSAALRTVLDERQLKVTILVQVVKLSPKH